MRPELTEDESIVTAWGERCSGPGWSNRLVWILVREGSGKLRIDCLQPEEQSPSLSTLLDISHEVSRTMAQQVRNVMGGRL